MNGEKLAIVRPVAMTAGSSLVTSSNVAELHTTYDPLEWNALTAYIIGDRAARASLHKVYQRRVAGTTATAPESDTTNWVEVGVTNKWKAFDDSYQSQVSNADTIQYVFTPAEYVDTVTVLNAQCKTATLSDGLTYNETADMYGRTVMDWYDYYFEQFVFKSDFSFLNVPLSLTAVLTLTLDNTGGTAMVGEIKMGRAREIGGVRYGARTGIIDYSAKTEDEWGNLVITQKPYRKRMSVEMWVLNTFIDEMHRLFSSYRATPIVIIGAGNLYECLIAYGFIRSFENVIAYPTDSMCSAEFEGLS